MGTKKFTAKKIAVLAVLTGLSLITFLIENLLPPMIFPGAKPGLANIFSFAAMIIYSPLEGFIVVGLRTVLGAAFAGNFSALMYSFTGGIVSMAVSSLLTYFVYPKISIIAVSIVSAVTHNIVQNTVYVFVSGSVLLFYYLPYMMLLGIISGTVVGLCTMLVFKGVPKNVFEQAILKNKN